MREINVLKNLFKILFKFETKIYIWIFVSNIYNKLKK
jgi:hypothetical protein